MRIWIQASCERNIGHKTQFDGNRPDRMGAAAGGIADDDGAVDGLHAVGKIFRAGKGAATCEDIDGLPQEYTIGFGRICPEYDGPIFSIDDVVHMCLYLKKIA